MLFIDYYEILNVNFDSSKDDIKHSFKKLAIKWHPDKNLGSDTTLKMQDLNEAYLILKDNEARQRYNVEYIKYYNQLEVDEVLINPNKYDDSTTKNNKNYDIEDYELLKWIKNAREQAVELAKMSLTDIKNITLQATEASLRAMAIQIAGIILFIVSIALLRSCQN
jgi:hypothetical protein